MSTLHLVPADLLKRYHVKEWRNATGILATACPKEWSELQEVLRQFTLLKSEVRIGGGNRSLISRRIDKPLYERLGQERSSDVHHRRREQNRRAQLTQSIASKAGVAVEMEWNNKDPFFDRDLKNFRLLFDLRAIQVGVIITRAWELQEISKSIEKAAPDGKGDNESSKNFGRRSKADGSGGCPNS